MVNLTIQALDDPYDTLKLKLTAAGIGFDGIQNNGAGTFTLRRINDQRVEEVKAIIAATDGVTLVSPYR